MHRLTVSNIMTRSFETLNPGDNLKIAALLMRRSKLDVLPVIGEDQRLMGLMTKANLYDAIAAGESTDTPVEKFFIKENVVTLQEDMSYDQVTEIVRMSKVGTAIVLNNNKKVVGIFTKASWIMAMFKNETILNNQMQLILNSMHNGLVAVDSRGLVTRINQTSEKLFGITADQAYGKPVPLCFQRFELEEVLLNGQISIGIKSTYGGRSLLCNITPIINGESINGAIIIFQDLTDLESIASDLENVTKLYNTLQSVMEIAYDGIIVIDNKGVITMANQAAVDFFHKPVEMVVGKSVEKVLENSRLYQVVKTGVAELHQLQFIGGTPYVVSNMPIIRDGKVLGAVGKILFSDFKDVRNLANKLISLDQKVAYYKNQFRNNTNNKITFDQIITSHEIFKKIKERAEIAARGSSSILITGESGTGKELMAQSIHEASSGRNKRLVKINCAAIPADLLESEFFGYASGAFTGAQKNGREGKLAMADGGTLFLDEIGDMSLGLQSKLLRVLQDKAFEPVGSNNTVRVDFRVIAATNQDLYQMVQEKCFRGDLYYRLNVIHFHIPPLRERPQDIILLVHFFIEKYNHILGSSIQDISDDAMNILLQHTWPGNVRELENVIERVANFVKGNIIETSDLPLNLKENDKKSAHCIRRIATKQFLQASREDHDKNTIKAALKEADGNKAEAARILGISRSWLYTKMSRVGL